MYNFNYHRASGLRQAANLLAKFEDAKLLAGGGTIGSMAGACAAKKKVPIPSASTRQTTPTLIANLRAMLLPGITGPTGSVCGKSVSAISQLSQKTEVPSIVRPR